MLLYYVTDSAGRPDRGRWLLDRIRDAAEAGIDFIQMREKDLSAREVFELARSALALLAGSPTRLLVNDRLDIALSAKAHGVHLPAAGLPISAVRAVCPPGFLIGRSCHSVEEVARAAEEDADLCVLGPVYDTPSKAGMGRPLGPDIFGHLPKTNMPVLALGGIDNVERAQQCVASGANGVAAIRLFQDHPLQPTVAQLKWR
jgi:thiamine-phosphate pyrophosphorylase